MSPFTSLAQMVTSERNHHAHTLLTMRELGVNGFGDKVREWNNRDQLEDWREAWERTANHYLEKHGHEERIARRTLEEQRSANVRIASANIADSRKTGSDTTTTATTVN